MRIHCGDFMRIHVCDLGGFFWFDVVFFGVWCEILYRKGFLFQSVSKLQLYLKVFWFLKAGHGRPLAIYFPRDQETGRRRFLFTIIFHWLRKFSVAGLVIRFCAKVERSEILNGANCQLQGIPPRFFQHFALKIFEYEDDKVADLSPQIHVRKQT